MTDNPTQQYAGHFISIWQYRPKLRPATRYALPEGIRWDYVEAPAMDGLANRPDLPRSAWHYGVICTDRELTAAECEHFDLAPVAGGK
jgi:hypothetical protein